MSAPLPAGCFVRLAKPDLQGLIEALRQDEFRVYGPVLADAAIVYDEIESIDALPIGQVDEQSPGQYRLRSAGQNYFDFVVGPHSLKNFLYPPRMLLIETVRVEGKWRSRAADAPVERRAYLGVRACDLAGLQVLDRVFASGPYNDPEYRKRRDNLFVLAVNCGRSASTCFCASMDTGPACTAGYDLLLTELPGHFVLEVGTPLGGRVLADVPWRPCTTAEVAEAQQVPKKAAQQQTRKIPAANIVKRIYDNLEDPRWEAIGERCLACANCTLVCPTCFCGAVQESTDVGGTVARRVRAWDSCFTDDHSYMNSGTIHRSTSSRYRQWLSHKFASWHQQFGTSGCVGCGRCITWCPVGIDVTEEVAAIGGGPS